MARDFTEADWRDRLATFTSTRAVAGRILGASARHGGLFSNSAFDNSSRRTGAEKNRGRQDDRPSRHHPFRLWPRRMPAELAAAYCGEPTVEAFKARVGTEYPEPRVKSGAAPTMAEGRPGPSNPAAGTRRGAGRRRGSVTMTRPLPDFVINKPLKGGQTAYYWTLPTYYRKLGSGCTWTATPQWAAIMRPPAGRTAKVESRYPERAF